MEFGIKQLKVNNAGGSAIILNDFLKYCDCDCITVVVDFLNVVLNTGCVPTEWCSGIIWPLCKNRVLLLTLISIGELHYCKLFTVM